MITKPFTAYLLHFPGPLHIGDMRDDYGVSCQTLSSDTMYAALTATLAKIGEAIPPTGDLGCTISSLFPYYQANQTEGPILFFPKPMSFSPTANDTQDIKTLKKITWVDLHYLESILKGDNLVKENTIADVHDKIYLTQSPCEKFIYSQVKNRVAVSRACEDANPFYMDDIHFTGHSGLYFLAEGNTKVIDKVLPLLMHEGIGTDRNVGHGHFEYQKKEIEIQVPEDSDMGLLLSTYIPTTSDILAQNLNHDGIAYQIVRRGGWITQIGYNTQRKNAIYAFDAGSVLHGLDSGNGAIVDLAPNNFKEHKIWRCGKSIVLPIKI